MHPFIVGSFIRMFDYTKPEFEELMEPTPVEETNPKLAKASSGAFNHNT
jgi:hypothetical protein